MRRIIIVISFVMMFILFAQGECRASVRLKRGRPLSEQIVRPNTTYVLRGDFNLEGKTLVFPAGCTLKVRRGSIANGTIKGQGTEIRIRKRGSFLSDVILQGTFSNKKAYLSWWKEETDITDEVSSLFQSFGHTIYLDRGGTLTGVVYISGKENIIIDGCNNTFVLDNIPNNCFFAKNNKNIEFRSFKISFLGCSVGGSASIIRCFRVEHGYESIVNLHDISIDGFNNIGEKLCSFNGISVVNCNYGSTTLLKNIHISNITVKGDGVEASGPGGNYGICVSCSQPKSGKVDISNCSISSLSNIDASGGHIYEDASGIYVGGRYKEGDGWQDCSWNCYIHDCSFTDVSKRNIKVQGNNVVIRNLTSSCTDKFLKDYKNMYIGAEGDSLTVEKLRGRYDGTIVKITGDYLFARDIHCSSELRGQQYARVFTLDGCLHADISDCEFDNEDYLFIYPTEKGFRGDVNPIYSFKGCRLHVRHLIYSVTDQKHIFTKGKLLVKNSDIRLAGTVCFNSAGLNEITFMDSRVQASVPYLYDDKNGNSPSMHNLNSIISCNNVK